MFMGPVGGESLPRHGPPNPSLTTVLLPQSDTESEYTRNKYSKYLGNIA